MVIGCDIFHWQEPLTLSKNNLVLYYICLYKRLTSVSHKSEATHAQDYMLEFRNLKMQILIVSRIFSK